MMIYSLIRQCGRELCSEYWRTEQSFYVRSSRQLRSLDEGEKMRGRKPSTRSEYYLPPKQYQYAVSFALMRDDWKAEIKSLEDQSRAIRYDKDKVQSSGDYNATESAAMEILEIRKKVDIIDETIEEVSEGLDYYIRLAVCNGFTYTQLTTGKYRMPLNHIAFGHIKHKFYYKLSQKI